ncbi:MAG: type I-E CRISPR-associated protein Cas6/Cse3/CasE [Syntrophales bacterium]|jgi:CRISPR system Cascade subunit CasE|nr:type I-E CRISPR-associated protein Cas6/Cse3/CasE [Syntrophales bacterium]MCK9528317.1 type I-E CRISPR-associated protein Cas6/Cse3/CasE [Syntrophales bacterium]MDX9922156.1 type I-E CRISPR-associated protein Cas6/Cse3/CasE [Syntrophales bacterium]
MYFSMITLQKGLSPRDVNALASYTGYQAHQLVWQLFADHEDRKRDFIYRYEVRNGTLILYTVSERKPAGEEKIWQIQTKEYKPKLRAGQLLGFTVRANPIRAKRKDDGQQKRHDVIMEEKLKLKKEDKIFNISDIVHNKGFQWLEERAASHGFNITPNDIRADGYRQHKFFKRKGSTPISLSTVDFNGMLTVTDPAVFIDRCLFRGLGPAKGFGCGLMLVRRV